MKCSGENVILRKIFHVCSIMFSTTFHIISRKFVLIFGKFILLNLKVLRKTRDGDKRKYSEYVDGRQETGNEERETGDW